ncbi:glutamate--tRNA ligase [uncultured Ilyobacter sp.]|uniref:glutamate--tRNA ligase n=1 Tax=uncultured Ilyobacter sp. TaxID=544433 RepID=UPI0029C6199B|nr:glutamate--tRNA ligase [uncultured Ilyobacter sp.]
MERRVRTRIAPSPTGDPHVGTAYIGLFNLAFAKKNDGDFILRIEDTDQERSTRESEEMIFETLKWLDINYSEGPDEGGEYGPYRQSERFHLYGDYARELVEKGEAYYCFCTRDRLDKLRERQKAMGKAPGYDGHCRSLSADDIKAKLEAGEEYVIRLKMPYEGTTVIKDRLRGDIVFENDKIDDQILLKGDGFPTYHLANVVDDYLMQITHVIRAEEWIASTPKHIQLYKAFGWESPEFIHMPLLRNSDRTKISKRKNPVSLNWYKEQGYLKEGLINFLGLMGYSFSDNREIFTLQEFIDNFDINHVSLGGPVFDLVKLGWVNNQHMRMKDLDELTDLAIPFFKEQNYIGEEVSEKEYNAVKRIVEILREGTHFLKELAENAAIYYHDDYDLPVADDEMNKKERKSIERMYSVINDEAGKASIKNFMDKMEKSGEELTEEEAKTLLNETLNEIGEGPGKVLMPLRVVITGQARGAELYQVISIIGRDRTLERIKNMVKKYNLF